MACLRRLPSPPWLDLGMAAPLKAAVMQPSLNKDFMRGLWGALPLLGLALQGTPALFYGTLGTLILWGAILSFLSLRSLLPRVVGRLSFFLLLVVFTVQADKLWGGTTEPLLLLPSLCLLSPSELFQSGKSWKKLVHSSFQTGFAFWTLLAGHGFWAEFMARRLGWPWFESPSGSYVWFALVLVAISVTRHRGLSPSYPEIQKRLSRLSET